MLPVRRGSCRQMCCILVALRACRLAEKAEGVRAPLSANGKSGHRGMCSERGPARDKHRLQAGPELRPSNGRRRSAVSSGTEMKYVFVCALNGPPSG